MLESKNEIDLINDIPDYSVVKNIVKEYHEVNKTYNSVNTVNNENINVNNNNFVTEADSVDNNRDVNEIKQVELYNPNNNQIQSSDIEELVFDNVENNGVNNG